MEFFRFSTCYNCIKTQGSKTTFSHPHFKFAIRCAIPGKQMQKLLIVKENSPNQQPLPNYSEIDRCSKGLGAEIEPANCMSSLLNVYVTLNDLFHQKCEALEGNKCILRPAVVKQFDRKTEGGTKFRGLFLFIQLCVTCFTMQPFFFSFPVVCFH